MSYKIVGTKIVGKTKAGTEASFLKENIDILINQCKSGGISNKYLIAGILATVAKESAFLPKNENLNYSAEGLKKTFPSYFKPSIANPSDYAKKPEKIANYVYAGRYGNNNQTDGYKYRGRGFNQITFKDLYKKYSTLISVDIESDPEKLNIVSNASKSTVSYYKESFKNKKQIISYYGVDPYSVNDWDIALKIVINVTAGLGYTPSASNVKYNYDKAKNYHQFLIDYLEKTPVGTPEEPKAEEVKPTDEQDLSNESQASNNDNNAQVPIYSLSKFFDAKIKPTDIKFDVSIFSEKDSKKIEKGLASVPFIWYNGLQISYNDIRKFTLFHSGILPAINITFLDTYGLFKEDAFPVDDVVITIYISSRSKDLRSIYMDFKVVNFKDCGEGVYNIEGICNIPGIYLRKFESVSKKTSHEALQQVAKDIDIGFYSNVQNTDDKMSWINTGNTRMSFILDIVENSYISDRSFLYCYIDFYYNLCYVDMSKEIDRDISNDMMYLTSGYSAFDDVKDNKIVNLLLTNDKSLSNTSCYFDTYEISNKSTEVSLKKAYMTRSKYYNNLTKELLVFDMDASTSDGSKSIILKARPGDDKFFKDNVTSVWLGKQDIFSDDGSGNVHKNYNYSIVQNRQNLDNITKISCKITLPTPNFNLYIYQKTPLIFSVKKKTPTHQEQFFKRLSGDWLITNIDYGFDDGKIYQIINLVKRELSLLPSEESEDSKPQSDVSNTNNQDNDFSPNDQKLEDANPPIPPNSNDIKENATEDKNSGKEDIYKKEGKSIYVIDSRYGVAGKLLTQFGKDLESYLNSNYPGKITIVSNGIMRELAQIVGNSNPNRSSTSKHGAGLAQDYKINTPKVKYDSLSANGKLVKDVKLVSLINNFVKNGSYKDIITWGGNFTGRSQEIVPGVGSICVTEFHHFEIKDKKMSTYWDPYKNKLSALGLKVPNTQKELSPIYQKGLSVYN